MALFAPTKLLLHHLKFVPLLGERCYIMRVVLCSASTITTRFPPYRQTVVMCHHGVSIGRRQTVAGCVC